MSDRMQELATNILTMKEGMDNDLLEENEKLDEDEGGYGEEEDKEDDLEEESEESEEKGE